MPMSAPLAETLTQLRVGNQKFLIDFYQRSRHLFDRWAQRQHQLAARHRPTSCCKTPCSTSTTKWPTAASP